MEHVVVRRHGGVVNKAHVVVAEALHPGAPGRGRGQTHPLPGRRVNHQVVPKQEKPVAVILDKRALVVLDITKACVADPVLCERVCEELWRVRAELLHEEDPVEREREEVRPQQMVVVDDGAPGFADTTGHGEAARRETAEHAREDVGVRRHHGHGY